LTSFASPLLAEQDPRNAKQVGRFTSPPLSSRLSPPRPADAADPHQKSLSVCLSPKNQADRDRDSSSNAMGQASERERGSSAPIRTATKYEHGRKEGSRSATERAGGWGGAVSFLAPLCVGGSKLRLPVDGRTDGSLRTSSAIHRRAM